MSYKGQGQCQVINSYVLYIISIGHIIYSGEVLDVRLTGSATCLVRPPFV